MTLEAIKARMQQLESQKKQLQANLFAIDGALQDCEYWFSQLDQPATVDAAWHLHPEQKGDES